MDLGNDPSGRYTLRQGPAKDGYMLADATDNETGKKYTARFLYRLASYHTSFLEKIQMEYQILGSLSHPLIEKIIETTYDKKVFAQIVECEDINFMDYYANDFPLPEYIAKEIFARLIEAICFLHKNNVVHLDIRPENIFIVENRFKLGGFVSSTFEDEEEMISGTYGTPQFQAPEVYINQNFDGRKADVWACGIFLYTILTGSLPFYDEKKPQLKNDINYIQKCILSEDLMIPKYLSEDVRDLLNSILIRDPTKRPSIQTIADHRWIYKAREKLQSDMTAPVPIRSEFITSIPPTFPIPNMFDSDRVLRTVVPLELSVVKENLGKFYQEQFITNIGNNCYVYSTHNVTIKIEFISTPDQISIEMRLINGNEYLFNELFASFTKDLSLLY